MVPSLRRSSAARSSATRVAIFVGAVLVGVSVRASATPACHLVQALDLAVKTATVGGAAHPAPSFAEGTFFFDATDNDLALGTFVITAYDPDTDMSRTLTLEVKP